MTSIAFPARISVQDSHTPQGSGVGRSINLFAGPLADSLADLLFGPLADQLADPTGVPIGVRQLRAIARMRAIVVFPMPRCPLKMYPWAIRPCSMAFLSVRVTWSCPITSENFCGRYLRART